jgi:hypothetical protein
MRFLFLLLTAALLCSCGKVQESSKPAEQQRSERDDAAKRARDNPVYGDQLKTLDKAKAVEEAVTKQAEETRKKSEE